MIPLLIDFSAVSKVKQPGSDNSPAWPNIKETLVTQTPPGLRLGAFLVSDTSGEIPRRLSLHLS